ncbi:flavin-containing monooxygenase [Polymorphobacter fuscus]|uniref:4-hydroxybenzoate brominase (decarboxylating) n=1 Tax=Sandarakinorhabdus fusca TaxID=1439888 RepID=A0A7C9KL09_9SPHN|nr:NAD(P)-binding domain-containing protein [Polymorphobacter fuscus]KAB7647577.1 NAD(P)-binding protein [Polymorphobacter fuscus]MQT16843.1 NAD(P)-binding protein [Polymorphobacter fuscus]NJC09168.1 cation diffusion facilitator CzcD-associated flavoprotein CzcO [Polymorphobacter fuscus]
MTTAQKIALIGAGCSGFTTAKRLRDAGLAFDWFEASDRIGGNWAYANPNGMSSAYQSLHIDTSKTRLQFEEFPVPADWPDFPHHSLIAAYFNAYVDHFGLRDLVRFDTPVTAVRRGGAGWDVTTPGGTATYSHVVVANGHHWSPNRPTWPGTFDGTILHAHDYKTPFAPVDMIGKRVLVVGMGNSAVDIASELGQRALTARLWVSTRRGVWVLPKSLNGKPVDKTPLPAWMPLGLVRKLAARTIIKAVGRMEDYGLPTPDHKPLEAHPTVSGEFLTRMSNGDIAIKPAIDRFDGAEVVFSDGSRETIDVIVTATGYNIDFPFLAPDDAPVTDNHIPLFKRMVQAEPALHGLWFMGLAQALPTLVNLAEQQSKLLVAYLTGRYALPDPATMAKAIADDEARYQGHYYASRRHTMQVNFEPYVADLVRETAAGARRLPRAA